MISRSPCGLHSSAVIADWQVSGPRFPDYTASPRPEPANGTTRTGLTVVIHIDISGGSLEMP
jgi:hypothetical protein